MLQLGQLSLKERTFCAPSSLHVNTAHVGTRPPKYRCWRQNQIDLACDAVVKRSFSVRRAAEPYGVPRSTLHDRIAGKVLPGSTNGPLKYLSSLEEEELVQFLHSCADIGYAKTRQQVLLLVQQIVKKKGLNVKVTNGWWESFRSRHEQISLRTGERLPYVRMQSSTPRIINNYFDLLYDTLSSNNLLEKPCLIFNVDETGMPLDPPALKVVAPRGVKHSQVVSSGDKSQITVVGCCSAAGFAMPPMVVFDRMKLRPEHTEGQVEGTTYGLSKSGWIDTELFEIWFKNHFLAYAPALCPLLLLLDGHSCHYQPSFIHSAAEEEVIVVECRLIMITSGVCIYNLLLGCLCILMIERYTYCY